MNHPIPSGTRDVLPDEMGEIRAISDALRDVFAGAGYGEVATPALEYEAVIERGDPAARAGDAAPAYRLFDEQGTVMVLRSDMTVPIARLVATRYPAAGLPLRFWYQAAAYRGVRPQRGQAREVLQAGIELIGSPAPDGTAEALTLLCRALDATGLRGYRIGVGDTALYPALMDACAVTGELREALLGALVARDFVGLRRAADGAGLAEPSVNLLVAVPQMRGGADVLDEAPAEAASAVEGLRAVHALLDPGVAERVIFDLGLARRLGYYTGAVFEVYDPALGAPLGGGGRYDELLGRFGRGLPAVGFALDLVRLHTALMGEEQGR